jgi:hypothetical protein
MLLNSRLGIDVAEVFDISGDDDRLDVEKLEATVIAPSEEVD